MPCPDCLPTFHHNSELAEEISGMHSMVRQQARREAALKRQLNEAHHGDPKAEDVLAVIEYWKGKVGRPRALARVDDDRGKAVKKALKHYEKRELYDMIDGIAIAPFLVYGKRRIVGSTDDRQDALEFVLKADTRVRECIEIAWRAKSASIDALHTAWERVHALERDHWKRLARHEAFSAFVVELEMDLNQRREAA